MKIKQKILKVKFKGIDEKAKLWLVWVFGVSFDSIKEILKENEK